MANKNIEKFERWSQGIQAGQVGLVRKQAIEEFFQAKAIHDEDRLRYAKIFRRVDSYQLGVSSLFPLVHPGHRKVRRPTAEEIIEYAANLIQLGGVTEGQKMLEPHTDHSEANLFLAFSHFANWEYDKAIPLLEAYLSGDLDEYAYLIGQVNLLAALVANRQTAEGDQLYGELIKRNPPELLLAAIDEIQSQNLILQKDYKAAEKKLKRVIGSVSENSFVGINARKWMHVLNPGKNISELKGLSRLAREMTMYEVHRDIEFRIAMADRKSHRLSKVYWGTPFISYRRRMIDEGIETPPQIVELAGPGRIKEVELGSESLKATEVERVLKILMSDQFHPFNHCRINDLLSAQAFYDPNSSRNRVNQLIMRLRVVLREKSIPLQVIHNKGGFFVHAEQKVRIKVSEELRPSKDQLELELRYRALKEAFGNSAFAAADAESVFQASARTTRRWLNALVEAGWQKKVGVRKGARYKIVSNGKERNKH